MRSQGYQSTRSFCNVFTVPETRKVEIASRLKAEPSIPAKRLIIDRIRERHGGVDRRYITGSRIERNVR
jgi:hypothetical protein